MVQDIGVLESIQKRGKKVVKGLESESWGTGEGGGIAETGDREDLIILYNYWKKLAELRWGWFPLPGNK